MTPADPSDVLGRLHAVLVERKGADADQSYVASLYKRGIDAILKKLGEEAVETVIAGKNPDDDALVRELADLWFHSMILISARGLSPAAVINELARRMGRSGLEEKASRPSQTP